MDENIDRLIELDERETARWREREALLAMLDVVVAQLPDALIVSDSHGDIVLFNQRAELMFGYQQNEVIGQRVEILLPERMRERHIQARALYSRYQVNERARTMGIGMDLIGLHKDGSEFPVEITLSRIVVPKGVLTLAIPRFVPDRRCQSVPSPRSEGHDGEAADA